MAVPPLDELPLEVGGLGLISRGSAKPDEEEEEEEEEDGEACALGSSEGSGAISGGGSGGWDWGIEVRVKGRGSTLGEMMRCFVLLHLWVRLPEPRPPLQRQAWVRGAGLVGCVSKICCTSCSTENSSVPFPQLHLMP